MGQGQAARDDGDDLKWRAEFKRRSRSALAGVHRPTLAELMASMPPLGGSLETDAQMFGELLAERLGVDAPADPDLLRRLRQLGMAPTPAACEAAASPLRAAWEAGKLFEAPHLADAAARCEYYAAATGSQGSAFRTAGRALVLACDATLPNAARAALFEASLGWLMLAARDLPDVVERLGPEMGGSPADRAAALGRGAMEGLELVACW